MMKRGSSNEEVKVRDEFPAAPKGRADPSKSKHDFIIQIKDRKWADELAEAGNMFFKVGGPERSFVYLPDSNPSDRNSIKSELLEGRNNRRAPCQCIDSPIGVEEIRHYGLLRGRVPLSRAL
jgi:hypothetical protein